MMIHHVEIHDRGIYMKIGQKEICFGGNKKLKIYGTLGGASGKRMKKENRVFFSSEKEAIENGYRPCAHCMRAKYKKWIADY